MVNLEHKLTVDDLIVEYMMYKICNGYEPSFLIGEFMSFLEFFEKRLPVSDVLYNGKSLFDRFFERKNEHDWSRTINWNTNKKEYNPHMEMEYSEKNNDYIIKANYGFSCFDSSIINTYFMDKNEVEGVRVIIGEFLIGFPKRKIDGLRSVNEEDLLISKYITAEIIDIIWNNYINSKIKNGNWPRQCTDINKYLFNFYLENIINIKSIKKELLEIYKVISRRIALLYKEDRNLKIRSNDNFTLANSNYNILIKDYEKIFNMTFGNNKSRLEIDLSIFSFKESHEMDGFYDYYDEPDMKTVVSKIENDKVKMLVKRLDNLKD